MDRQWLRECSHGTYLLSNPFAAFIMEVNLPTNFQFPSHLDPYDGTSDPQYHVQAFCVSMMLSLPSDPIMCRAFVTTLKHAALKWFLALPPNSIHCFRDLTEAFISHFDIRVYKKTLGLLFYIRQRERESLKHFMARFLKEISEIRDISSTNDSSLLYILRQGVRNEEFSLWLTINRQISLNDAIAASVGYINMEEELKLKVDYDKHRKRDL